MIDGLGYGDSHQEVYDETHSHGTRKALMDFKCKIQDTLCFLPFQLCFCLGDTGYQKPELGLMGLVS